MDSQYHRQPQDAVIVHHQVLRTIISAAAQSVAGVARLGSAGGALDRWLRFDLSDDGIRLRVEADEIAVDMSLVVDARYHMFDISTAVQHEVSRRLEEYVGMQVKTVNIHIEDVVWAEEGEP